MRRHGHQVAALDRASELLLTRVHKGLLWFCLQLLGPTFWNQPSHFLLFPPAGSCHGDRS